MQISLFEALRTSCSEESGLTLFNSAFPRLPCWCSLCGRVVSVPQCQCSMECTLEQTAIKEVGNLAKG